MKKIEQRFSDLESAKNALMNVLKKNDVTMAKIEVYAYPRYAQTSLLVYSTRSNPQNNSHMINKIKNVERGSIAIHCNVPLLSLDKDGESYTLWYYD